jgi:predicted  nucleic acid-binding Zn-ribbon protein
MPSRPGGFGYHTADGLGEYEDWQDQKVAIEIDLRSSETRVTALQNEINKNELKFEREIEDLKRQLAEKIYKI